MFLKEEQEVLTAARIEGGLTCLVGIYTVSDNPVNKYSSAGAVSLGVLIDARPLSFRLPSRKAKRTGFMDWDWKDNLPAAFAHGCRG